MTPIAEHYVREEPSEIMAPPVAGTSELQRFDNAERVPCDIMRNGFEHALRFTNLDDELYRLSSNYNLFHMIYTYYDSHTLFSMGLIIILFKR